jgi:hypothetical protein
MRPTQPSWTIYTYDGSGRTVGVQSPDGSSTTNYLYQGNTVKVTDPALKWKTFTMDATGKLTSVLEPEPSDPVNLWDPSGLCGGGGPGLPDLPGPPPAKLPFTYIQNDYGYCALPPEPQEGGGGNSSVQDAQSLARKLKDLNCDVLGIFNIRGQDWNNNLDNLIKGTTGVAGSGIIDGESLQTVHVFDLWAHTSGVPDQIKALGNPTIADVFKNGYGGEKPDAIAVFNYPTIYIKGSVFTSGNDMANIALLMHEILHTFGFTHEQIVAKLQLTDTGEINADLGKRCHLEKLVQ